MPMSVKSKISCILICCVACYIHKRSFEPMQQNLPNTSTLSLLLHQQSQFQLQLSFAASPLCTTRLASTWLRSLFSPNAALCAVYARDSSNETAQQVAESKKWLAVAALFTDSSQCQATADQASISPPDTGTTTRQAAAAPPSESTQQSTSNSQSSSMQTGFSKHAPVHSAAEVTQSASSASCASHQPSISHAHGQTKSGPEGAESVQSVQTATTEAHEQLIEATAAASTVTLKNDSCENASAATSRDLTAAASVIREHGKA